MPSYLLLSIAFLLFSFSGINYANDIDRINRLENEMKKLDSRLSVLESAADQDARNQPEDEKSLSSWRKLSINMSTIEVLKILGEPVRLDGGHIAYWHYDKGGVVIFLNDKVRQWTEPSQ